ncbi:MAG: hypothetical protein G01um10147_1038 [Microgenomates group bacterium Gr01-1014_7]|nr:MAG: hypothetical protein G01um10147_1038 [Microgenomates group bacterium Gr01-1014_7]
MERVKEGITKKYTGKLYTPAGSWKEDSDILFTPNDAVYVWRLLHKAGIIPNTQKDLVFISPSANQPTQEAAIWLDERKRDRPRTTFLAGDLLQTNPYCLMQAVQPLQNENHKFAYFRWDAEYLPVAPNSADIIWDRKGWIWHCVNDLKDKTRLRNTFDAYWNILKPGGSLVLDNMNQYADYFRNLNFFDFIIGIFKSICANHFGVNMDEHE